MSRSVYYVLLVLITLCMSMSCSNSGGDSKEQKPPASLEQRVLIKKKLMSITKYDISVNTDTKVLKRFKTAVQKLLKRDSPLVDTCSGEGSMSLYTDYSQKIEGQLSCFGIKFNIADTLAAPDIDRVQEDMSKYSYYGYVIRELNPPITDKKIPAGTAYFRPPRILITNPLVDSSKIPTEIVENTTVVTSNSAGVQTKSSGTITIKVLNTKADIPSDIDSSFIKGDIMHLDVQVAGFTNIPNKAQYLLFPSRQMYVSLNPVIISKMIITAPMADILNSSDTKISGNFLKTFVEHLTITFSMKDHEIK